MQPVNSAYHYPATAPILPTLTPAKVQLIEQSPFLTNGEKISLLAILCRLKWLTELGLKRPALIEKADECLAPLLSTLGLAFAPADYQHSTRGLVRWMQVAATRPLLDYVLDRRNSLTVLEAGVLYGYPTSHVLGFMRLIAPTVSPSRTAAAHFLAGVFSAPCVEQEQDHFRRIWEELRQISPATIRAAEDEWRSAQAT
jgi:hypothetical protein